MGYEIKEMLIPGLPKTNYRNGYGKYEGVVAHSTATPEAPAINIRNFEARTWKNAFVHYAVDWNEIIHIAQDEYMAYGAGPRANPRFVHVELCETSNRSKFLESYKRYVWLLARILKARGLGVSLGGSLWGHSEVTHTLGGTDHEDPYDYLRSHGVSKSQFVQDVKNAYAGDTSGIVVTPPTKPVDPPTPPANGNWQGKRVRSKVDALRFYSSPSWTDLAGTVDKGSGFPSILGMVTVEGAPQYKVANSNGAVFYITASPSFVELVDGGTGPTNHSGDEGKRVESKVSGLNFYDRPTWNKAYVVGQVDVGLGFTIIDKVWVEDAYQYKVKNSRGAVYYITASPSYVVVK